MFRLAVVVALCAGLASAALTEQQYQQQFSSWAIRHNRKYEASELLHRFRVFKDNVDLINNHNSKNASYTMGVNQFADMTEEEFAAWVRAIPTPRPTGEMKPFVPRRAASGPMDWRDRGGVLPVKDQGQCGSCWAFSTTGPLETWLWLATGNLVSLSEQQLVDCSKDECYGCRGGWPYKSMEYVQKNGLCTESDYRYTARDGQCRESQCTPIIKPGMLQDYTKLSGEAQFKDAVLDGTISVLVRAGASAFQFYRSGILDDPSCGTNIDHAITLTGWNTEGGKDYWIVKNSWGKAWGLQGYVQMVAGKNQCGIDWGAVQPKPIW